MAKLKGAEILIKSLIEEGVTHMFGYPGGSVIPLTDKLYGEKAIKFILTRHEQGAAHAADGYARATGRPGVCFAQCVGAANLAAGLRDAHLACAPLVVFTGGPDDTTRHRHTYQQIDDFPLFRPVTKYSARVDDVTRLPDVLRQAFRAATTGNPGPAHIELAGHQGELERQIGDLPTVPEPQFGRIPTARPLADAEAVAQVARLIEQAERPVIIAGGGAHMFF